MKAKTVGERLRTLRGSRTQQEVADAVGITQQAYANYESGLRMPRDNIKVRIAEYYGRTVSYIFF